jgi:hypothetical protein
VIFFKSARIHYAELVKSARNWEPFRLFFNPRGSFFVFLVRIRPHLRIGPGEIFFALENILQKSNFYLLLFFVFVLKERV